MVEKSLVPLEHVERVILFLREQKVLLDSDLAALYGVPVKALNQAVKRNLARLPEDFMFQLTLEEARRRSPPRRPGWSSVTSISSISRRSWVWPRARRLSGAFPRKRGATARRA
jgi:hypothetical protein